MSQSAPSSGLLTFYKAPWIRALVQLVPGIGGSIDTLLVAHVDAMRDRRLRVFFDALAQGSVELTDAMIESEDFLHCYFRTLKAVSNTRRDEKIRLFAEMFRSSLTVAASNEKVDEFEECIDVLEQLSLREWRALVILDSFSLMPRSEKQNDLQWSRTFWNQFVEKLGDDLAIDKHEAGDFMNAISRTGLYEQFVGGFMDYTGGVGRLTPRFHRLARLITQASPNGKASVGGGP